MCPRFDSRQAAYAFDQSLSFDTSSVTDMNGMFYVRSSPAALPLRIEPSRTRCVHRCRYRCRPPSPASRPAQLAPHRMPSFRLSAERVARRCDHGARLSSAGVQPATKLRHVQRHNHGLDVLRALLPVPCSRRALPCMLRVPPSPATSRTSRGLHLIPRIVSPFRLLAEHVGVQPAAEFRHVQRHKHEQHVRGGTALLPMP